MCTRLAAFLLLVAATPLRAQPASAAALVAARGLARVHLVAAFAAAGPLARREVPALAALLAHPDVEVRRSACEALGGVGITARSALPALIAAARDPRDPARLPAIAALGAIGDAAATEPLVELLASPGAVRDAALVALGRIGPPARRAGASVRAWLGDSSGQTREAAAATLGLLHARTFADAAALTRAARDTATGRPMYGTLAQPRTARLAEAQVASYGVLEPLTLALRDPLPGVRGAAATAIGQIVGWPLEIRGDLGTRKRLVAYVDDGPHQLRGDGQGYYDAMPIVALCLQPTECSNRVGPPSAHAGRRTLAIDLSRPVPGSGARALGIVRDPDTFVTVNWDQDSTRVVPCRDAFCAAPRAVTQLPVDSTVASERVEVRFYLGGRKHLLQFGPWVTGQWSGVGGVRGDGTTRASVTRPAFWSWVVELPAGSRGRLFDISNPERAVDLGLYEFGLRVFFESRDNHDLMPLAW